MTGTFTSPGDTEDTTVLSRTASYIRTNQSAPSTTEITTIVRLLEALSACSMGSLNEEDPKVCLIKAFGTLGEMTYIEVFRSLMNYRSSLSHWTSILQSLNQTGFMPVASQIEARELASFLCAFSQRLSSNGRGLTLAQIPARETRAHIVCTYALPKASIPDWLKSMLVQMDSSSAHSTQSPPS